MYSYMLYNHHVKHLNSIIIKSAFCTTVIVHIFT